MAALWVASNAQPALDDRLFLHFEPHLVRTNAAVHVMASKTPKIVKTHPYPMALSMGSRTATMKTERTARNVPCRSGGARPFGEDVNDQGVRKSGA